jgi:hypothetical protein
VAQAGNYKAADYLQKSAARGGRLPLLHNPLPHEGTGKRYFAYLSNLRPWSAVPSIKGYAPCPALVAG